MYIFAVALEDGDWHHVKSYTKARAKRKSTVKIWRSIKTHEDKKWTRKYHDPNPKKKSFGAKVIITFKNGKKVSDTLTDNIAKIGENMTLRRMEAIEAERVVAYVHNSAAQDMGQIGVLVAINGENTEFARQVAMHVAAANPQALSSAELEQSVVEREKNILTEQARESGKPEQVIEKMIQGRMKKFLAEVTLLGQDFVINPDLTVEAAAREAGVEIVSYVRMAVGEGIEKVEEDFAAEVAKAAQS